MLKKISLFLMIVCVLCQSVTTYAESVPTLTVESVEASAGEKITVNINIKNNPGFAAMVIDLSYDNNYLTPVSVEGCEVLGDIGIISNIQKGGDLRQYNPISLTVINPADIKGNGQVFAVTFNISDNVEDDIELNLSYKKSNISNQEYEDVNFKIVQGIVRVRSESTPDKSNDTLIEDGGEKTEEDEEEDNEDIVQMPEEEPEDSEPDIDESSEDEKEIKRPVKNPDGKENIPEPVINTTNDIWVLIDNERVMFDQQPIVEKERVLVPMRAIFEKLGAKVDWDGDSKTAIGEKNGIVVKIQIDNNIMKKGEEEVVLDVPSRALSNRTLVPLRAISEAFGCDVDWIGETKTVTIVTNK